MEVDELGKFLRKDADQIRAAMKDAEAKAKTQKQLEEDRLKAMSIMSRLVIEIEKAMQEAFGGEDGLFSKENLASVKETLSTFFDVVKRIGGIFKQIYGYWKDTFGGDDLKATLATMGTVFGGVNLLKAAPGMIFSGLGKLGSMALERRRRKK